MTQRHCGKQLVFIFLVISLSILPFAGEGAISETYQYEKKERSEEQKRYIARLNKDKNKVDMAIQNTRALIDKSRNRPYLPQLYLRLAELYIEKSRIVYFLRKTESGRSVRSLEQLESNALKKQAIEIYQRILGNFPNFEDQDKVLFFMAHEYRELGQIDEMLKQYLTIIREYKESPYVPECYLLLGDHFFNTQDIEMAQRHYEAVLKYPESAAISIARYKLAWCYINNADFEKAIKLFEGSVTSPDSDKKVDIDTYKRVDIRLESLIDMAYCYSESYKDSTPREALAYFQRYAWSRPAYTIALEKLANRYFIKKKWHHAAVIYRHLSIFQRDAGKLLEYAGNIFECVRAMETFEDADKDMSIIVKALKRQRYSIHIPDEEKEKNLTDYELYARDIVTHLHHKAREAKSVAEFKRTADSYKLYLGFFDNSPVYEEMESNYAEALFSANRYIEAGKQYERLAQRMPHKDKEREEKLYGAVLSYYYALKNKDNLDYYQTVFARDGLKVTGRSYVSYFPDSSRVPDVLFNIAWITYDEGRYDEAIAEFSRFAERYPKSREVKTAIHLILDTFHLKEDYEGLVRYGQKIINNSRIEKKLKGEIREIVLAAESKIIYSRTLVAVKNWEEGKKDLSDFAEQHISSSLGEQALNALIVTSKEKGDLETLLSAGSRLVTQYPNSPKIEGILSLMIDASLRTSQFRLVAKYLEQYAKRLPGNINSVDFLYQAGHIRENLGQYDLANKDYQLILDHFKKGGSMREEIIFAMADNAERMGNDDSVISILLKNSEHLSKLGKIKADARIADLYLQNGRFKKALRYRKSAYRAYKPEFAKKDSKINSIIAQMAYNAVNRLKEKYMGIRLKGRIDNQIVAKKAKLLEKLENGYYTVIQYQSPEWALKACYSSYEINREFARFLKESPLPPDLTPGQQKQYLQIINQKARAYMEKADQYLETGVEQAHKWEICDPKLAAYFNTSSESSREYGSYSGSISSVEIEAEYLQDESLRNFHSRLMQNPKDTNTLRALAEAYIERGDFRHSILIAQKTLDEIQDKPEPLRASVYNILGVAYLNSSVDSLAKDAFKKALAIDPENIGARINLAGLYRYYGHIAEANSIYNSLPDTGVVEDAGDLIHQRSRKFYYKRKNLGALLQLK
ncbi:MAG: tetratricopeptide repeat protein [Nitrospinota bacterium]